MTLKRFESFDSDINKIWIVGVPSGEAFQVTRDELDILFDDRVLFYETRYVSIGFFAFKDIDVDKVKKYVTKNKKPKKDIIIFDNQFDRIVSDTIIDIVDMYPEKMELYISGDIMGITYGPLYLEISINDSTKPGKYEIVKKRKNVVIDKYVAGNDTLLLKALDQELYKA